MTLDLLSALIVLVPTLGAVAVGLTGHVPNLRDLVTFMTTLVTFGLVTRLVPTVTAGGRPEIDLLEVVPGLTIGFRVEPLGMLFALVASGLWIVTSVYAVGYMRKHEESHQTRFFICFALAITAALGIAFARNLFTLFLFYELMTVCTYPLVTHHGTPEAKQAGRVYLGILMSTSIGLLLVAMAWIYHLTGTLEFRQGGILEGHVEGPLIAVLLGLVAFGTGKAALMPLHRWLPAAMVAPTPVSALLHAVAVVKAGVFTILKVVVYIFGIDFLHQAGASDWLMMVASITIIVSSLIALQQNNLKARLAYSTVSQLSYIVLGAALATQVSVTGASMHIAVHAMGKITLFFCAGAFYITAHKTKVSELDGIGRTMPATLTAFFIGSVAIIGIPPFSAWSKFSLGLGSADGSHAWYLGVLVVSALLNVAYLMPIVARGFFLPPPRNEHDDQYGHANSGMQKAGIQEAPALCLVPLCLTALGCIVIFFLDRPLQQLLSSMVP